MDSEPLDLSDADRELIDRLAVRLVELHLEVPAILTLESGKPLSLLAGQTLAFFEPMIQSLFRIQEYRRFAALIERRETLEVLIQAIERHAEAARQERAHPRDATRPEGGPPSDPAAKG